ncbi:GNAT family N-acetyltransferase [Salirhabdus salicampi]|uniref:GNAT family N-acetyltransferase n=1 Tax=Salirhabdus salicampi TaxID=476102 RepID=UPI0020C1ED8B|nr:GNAT family N-acetyltransferase [Salirhabdus salicampi]MCP8617950.1 GNAT family N-acetyltransferase [Salirhabdus salicampi]
MAHIPKQHHYMKDGTPYTIETVTEKDGMNVIRYVKQTLLESTYLVTTAKEYRPTMKQQCNHINNIYANPNKLMICAKMGQTIIGTLDFHNGNKHKTKHTGSFGMSVAKRYQGQGIGKVLLKTLIDWASSHPLIEKVDLEVMRNNDQAISLYKKNDFITEGVRKHAIKVNNEYYDLLLMTKYVRS